VDTTGSVELNSMPTAISIVDDWRNYDLSMASSPNVSSSPKCELDATAVKVQKVTRVTAPGETSLIARSL
jgi:hypothetical protein